MKKRTIIFVRHGLAEPKDACVPDFERSLTKEGKHACTEVAKRIQKQQVKAKRWISSPAIRALQTARLFAKEMNIARKSISLEPAIYNENTADGVLQFLKGQDDKNPSVILFGHDPAFSQLVKRLVRGFTFSIPKAGVVVIQWEGSWQDLKGRCAQLRLMTFPMVKKQRSRYKEYWKQVGQSMQQQMQSVANKVDSGIQPLVENQIPDFCDNIMKKWSKKKIKYVLTSVKEIKAVLAEEPAAPKTIITTPRVESGADKKKQQIARKSRKATPSVKKRTPSATNDTPPKQASEGSTSPSPK